MENKKIECNLCGSRNYETVYRTEPSPQKPKRIFKCSNCGLIFAEQDRGLKYYIDMHSSLVDREYVKEEKGRRRASIKILEKIEKIKKRGRLLEVGCVTGFFLDEARRRNWECHGIDLSKWAVNYAREKLNLNVIRGSLKKAAFPDKFFDVIIMMDVIERLPDPKQTLLEMRRILKDDGIVYISTPNISSLISKVLRTKWWGINKLHLYYFTKNIFERMCDAAGFKVKRYTSHTRVFSLAFWASRFKPYSPFLYKSLDFISRLDNIGGKLITINFHDQIEALVVKARKLDYLVSSVTQKEKSDKQVKKNMRVFVVLPAFNAERTLRKTVADIPKDIVEKVILTDDKSSDKTVEIAKNLGLEILKHKKNMGYGANQKTSYKRALELGADIVVMVHPDYQYDPTIIPKLIEPIVKGEADAVFGSRMMKGGALEGGMPLWKHNINIILTAFENVVLGTYLTEYHSGFRAYSANLLKTINFQLNSDKFVFDTEIIVQALIHHFKIEEIPIQTRYFDEASKIKLIPGIMYSFGIMMTMIKYMLHVRGIYRFKQFE